jgi:hypothetical protein
LSIAKSTANVMDMSTRSSAQSLDGVVEAPVALEAAVVRDRSKRHDLGESDVAGPLVESTNEVPMQFVRLGLPAAISLWFVVGLVVYGAYRFISG